MPREAVERAAAAVSGAFRTPEVADRLRQIAFIPWFIAPDDLTALIETETARWLLLAQDINTQPR
jgi:tripartite-type tricarboxylate transporter receptor subunit TctC